MHGCVAPSLPALRYTPAATPPPLLPALLLSQAAPGAGSVIMPLLSNGLVANEVLRWKAIGAAAWLAAVAVAANAVLSLALSPAALLSPVQLFASLFSPTAWLAAVALLLAQAPAFAAQAASLTTREPCPRLTCRLLLLPRLPGLAAGLGKLAARASSVMGAARLAAFYGLHAASAVLCLSLFASSRGAASPGAEAGWLTFCRRGCLGGRQQVHHSECRWSAVPRLNLEQPA